jgi:fructan beta-fructosidase
MTDSLYTESLRPQFHFTSKAGWLNDPNGLVYYSGEYHLFFQHNPFGTDWGHMTWGHAVSTDLVHWKQLAHAIEPDSLGTIFSGSAVVDWANTAGFQTGPEKALVAIYTAAGHTLTPPRPTTQCLASSTDCGRTWTKFAGNPILDQIACGNRDPKVFWHAPTRCWIMALYLEAQGESQGVNAIRIFSSPDLKQWTTRSTLDGFYECPDLFELPVEGDPVQTRWVLFGADGCYAIGSFDGERFQVESGKHTGDYGANFYAAQTFNDMPAGDGRRITVGWMVGGRYPKMPFNQQMTFPCELTLRRYPEGLRLCKYPVREIERLYTRQHAYTHQTVRTGQNPLRELNGDLFDIDADVELGTALEFGFIIRGHKVSYRVGDQELFGLLSVDRSRGGVHLPTVGNRIQLRLLVDRTSVEVYGNGGRVASSSCFLPQADNRTLSFFSQGGTVHVHSLRVRELQSAWEPG